jgi:ornithine cyclodeaminase
MILLDDARIKEIVDPLGLAGALTEAFKHPGETPTRLHLDLPGGDDAKLLIMPSWSGRDAVGVKVITVTPSNASHNRPTVDGVYVLMDGQTGEPLAMLSAPALTAVRTAGVCALAASLLARRDARVLLMIGAGVLAPHLVRAYVALLRLDRVILWGRDPRKADFLACQLSDLPVAVETAARLPAALARADIICSATLSAEPLIEGRRLAPGAHVDLVGSFTQTMREADSEVFRRGRLFVDTKTAFEESGDLIAPLREGLIGRDAPDLTDLLKSPALGRATDHEVTVFKTVGTGLADLAAARFIVAHANATSLTSPEGAQKPLEIG